MVFHVGKYCTYVDLTFTMHVGQALVLAIHVTYFTPTNANITSRTVCCGANIATKLEDSLTQ